MASTAKDPDVRLEGFEHPIPKEVLWGLAGVGLPALSEEDIKKLPESQLVEMLIAKKKQGYSAENINKKGNKRLSPEDRAVRIRKSLDDANSPMSKKTELARHAGKLADYKEMILGFYKAVYHLDEDNSEVVQVRAKVEDMRKVHEEFQRKATLLNTILNALDLQLVQTEPDEEFKPMEHESEDNWCDWMGTIFGE
ncbi:hypothetical protein BDV96DRAFT_600796 [Lophiotrema nucula]|uniref:Uncharacterized protein n=1 Tax=Lophiotrema nucula TaxID=690887 RepID=A0A6A5Z4N9_9PLEO|nr:hypothetical protein BDV96DRAFT_600796 [Lophiotrema nucula]